MNFGLRENPGRGAGTGAETTMRRRKQPRPTDAELGILRVLWDHGPATVRDVQSVLSKRQKKPGYTTVLKLLQIMAEKGLVERDESSRSHVYRARLPAEQTQRQLVGDLLERAFGGSARKLVMQALAAKKTSAAELAEIRWLLDQLEKEVT
jgi:predicted transcriptional regulator